MKDGNGAELDGVLKTSVTAFSESDRGPRTDPETLIVREQVVAAWDSDCERVSRVCRQLRICRKTGYKWIVRYIQTESMLDLSRRPHHSPSAIAPELEALIVQVRKREPHVGARRLRAALEREPSVSRVPSVATITRVLKRNGLVGTQRGTEGPATMTVAGDDDRSRRR